MANFTVVTEALVSCNHNASSQSYCTTVDPSVCPNQPSCRLQSTSLHLLARTNIGLGRVVRFGSICGVFKFGVVW